MAVRLNLAQDERTRAKIQTSQLVNRLNQISKGEIEGEPAALAVQVKAALGLLAKVLPDVKAIEHSGDLNVGVTIKDEWARSNPAE